MTTFKELERTGWHERAALYDGRAGQMTRHAANRLLDAVGAVAPMQLLDVCCGPGYSAGEAAARGCTAVGIDLAAGMVAEAQRRFPAATFRVGDAEALDVADASVDAVVCGFGVLHLPEPERALAEAFRVLRPGGRYAFAVWCRPDKAQLSGIAQAAIAAHADMSVPLPPAPPREQYSDADFAARSLAAIGFTETRSEEIPLTFRAQRPEDVWEWYDRATVRTAALLALQTPAVREQIRAAILAGAARYAQDGAIVVPNHAIMHVARKPR
jgi:ubiquinone/menaquinone biosynthesis C-methylase UbiE